MNIIDSSFSSNHKQYMYLSINDSATHKKHIYIILYYIYLLIYFMCIELFFLGNTVNIWNVFLTTMTLYIYKYVSAKFS